MKNVLIILVVLMMPFLGHAQYAVKTNLLYDATTTPNLGLEVGFKGKSTFNVVYGINPWSFSSNHNGARFAKHWVVMPEYRWWPCSRFNGHFIGVHLTGGEYNACNVSLPIPGFFTGGADLRKDVRDGRYQGWFLGSGLTYGYQLSLSRHWNIEAEIGAGYIHARYSHFPSGACGLAIEKGDTNYLGLTKLGLSLIYVF